MPPQFKKPVEYDPQLAEQTLHKSYQHSAEAQQNKKRTLLAELGLADEEYELEDEDDIGEEEEEDDEPLIMNGGSAGGARHSHGNGGPARALPSYGYRDLFGKEWEKRRRQMIDLKGYDQYLTDLLERSYEQLQALRAEPGLQYPGNVEVIPELQHELRVMHEEVKGLRAGHPPSQPHAHTNGDAVNGEVAKQVAALQSQLAARDARLKEAEAEALRLKARLAASDAAGPRDGGSDPQLQAKLAATEAQLHAVQAELRSARHSGSGSSLGGAAAANVAELQRQRDEAVQARELLQQQLAHARAEMTATEAAHVKQLAAVASSSEGEQAAELQKQLWTLTEQHRRQVEELQADLKQQQVLVQQLQSTKSDALAAMKEMKGKMVAAKSEAAQGFKLQLAELQAKVDKLHALREGVLEELVSFQAEIFSEKPIMQMVRMVRDREIARVRSAQSDLRTKLSDMEAQLRESRDEVAGVREQAEQMARIRELEAQGQIAHFRDKWRAEFDKRRKLHNMVVELKGNIRVLCRMRPLLEKEKGSLGPDGLPVKALSEEAVRVVAVDNKAEKDYEFDRVLSPEEGQDKVYDEVAALVTSVLDGFNVAIMAYGQTGSGKTFTMEGPEGEPGVNLRALGDLFRLATERSTDFTYGFSASVLEIYNEQIYDLLASGKQDGDKLDIKQGPEGMFVPGLRVEEVANMDEVTAMISRGKSNRSTYATNMNEHSSRSHLVLSVYITATSRTTGSVLKGKLHLIDLAGSERLSRTGAQGDRLKEAQSINKSLSALGDVIQALQQRQAHIPYRNSKLTRLLEDSLGGNSKCIMIVNVSPAAENVPESKCSLEFASRARKVELGRARANVVSGEGNTPTASPGPSRPMSGRATPAGEGAMSRSASRETMSLSTGRRTPGASTLGR